MFCLKVSGVQRGDEVIDAPREIRFGSLDFLDIQYVYRAVIDIICDYQIRNS